MVEPPKPNKPSTKVKARGAKGKVRSTKARVVLTRKVATIPEGEVGALGFLVVVVAVVVVKVAVKKRRKVKNDQAHKCTKFLLGVGAGSVARVVFVVAVVVVLLVAVAVVGQPDSLANHHQKKLPLPVPGLFSLVSLSKLLI